MRAGPSVRRYATRCSDVRSRHRENSEIYIDTRGDQATGMLIISAEPRELTIVNIVGPIDVEKLSALEGNFGVPYVSKDKNHD